MGLPAVLGQQHDYQSCGDPDCPRFACKVYKEGYGDGHGDGSADGWSAGYADGYLRRRSGERVTGDDRAHPASAALWPRAVRRAAASVPDRTVPALLRQTGPSAAAAQPRKCWACGGRGRVVWPGATAVHRFWWLLLGHRLMESRRDTIRARQPGED